MKIILKYLITNIKEKKLRTLLIILAITLSSALYFGTSGMGTTLEEMFTQRFKQYYGTADIMLYSGEKSPHWNFRSDIMEPYSPLLKYSVGSMNSSATYSRGNEKINFGILGFHYEDLEKLNPLTIEESNDLFPFEGNKIILPRHTADKYAFRVGDTIAIDLVGAKRHFVIAGIGASQGFFMDDGNESHPAIIPLNKLSGLHNARGRVSIIYVAVKDGLFPKTVLAELQKGLKRYWIRETVSAEQKKQWAQSITVPFKIMMVLVLGISVFIIFTCFQVITAERLPIIGTFRSIGASRKITDLILLGESLLYGLVGGGLGIFLGIGVMSLLIRMSVGGWLSAVEVNLSFSPFQVFSGLLLALILSLFSSGIPIIKISRLSIKDVILNSSETYKPPGKKRLCLGLFFILFGTIVPVFVKNEVAMAVDVLALVAIMVGMISLNPFIINFFVLIFEKIYILLFGNIGILGAKNLKENTSILHNLGLLSIGIGGLFMIFTISSSVSISLSNTYGNANYEAEVSMWGANRYIEYRIRAVKGVEKTTGYYSLWDVKLKDFDSAIRSVHGIDPVGYLEFWKINSKEGSAALFKGFEEGRNIILTYTLKKRFKINKGDFLTLEINGKDRQYKVHGFFSTSRYDGDFGLIPDLYMRSDGKLSRYNRILLKISTDIESVLERVREKFKRYNPWVMSVKELQIRNTQNFNSLFGILKGFGFLALFIGIVGIINNFIISFIKRKRSIALLRSVGMSQKQTISMLFVEALSCGIAGAAMGLATGFMMFISIPFLLDAYELPVKIIFTLPIPIFLFIGGIGVTLLATVVPSMRTSKLDILEAMKYE